MNGLEKKLAQKNEEGGNDDFFSKFAKKVRDQRTTKSQPRKWWLVKK